MSPSQGAKGNKKVFVIGLDCADPELIFDRWREDLPNLSRLMGGGLYGPLTSSHPPITVPAWSSMLPVSGAMAFAWESARFPRADMMQLVESLAPLMVLNHPPYDGLAHRVDRVIKRRDVLVARPLAAARHDSGE